MISKFNSLLLIVALLCISHDPNANHFALNHNIQSFVLTKLQSHDIVLLGTRHKQQPILEFISNLIPKLNNSGVTRFGLDVASDQQSKIDRFKNTVQD